MDRMTAYYYIQYLEMSGLSDRFQVRFDGKEYRVVRSDAPDDEGEANNSNNGTKKSSIRYGLPYGLCKSKGIDLPKSATPKDAWEALKGKGVSPEKEYAKAEKEAQKKQTQTDTPKGGYKSIEEWAEQNDDFASLPAAITDIPSLKNFAERRREVRKNLVDYIEDEFDIKLSADDINEIEDALTGFVENSEFRMRVRSNVLDNIISDGFKNQLQTGTSGGACNPELRKGLSHIDFGTDYYTDPSGFEKYGYLEPKPKDNEKNVYQSGIDNYLYGAIDVVFKKDAVKNRITLTAGDSLDLCEWDYIDPKTRCAGSVINGRVGLETLSCNHYLLGQFAKYAKYDKSKLSEYKKGNVNAPDGSKAYKPDGESYWEVQYHGKLTIKDVDRVIFPKYPDSEQQVDKLKAAGVKTYYEDASGKLVEI